MAILQRGQVDVAGGVICWGGEGPQENSVLAEDRSRLIASGGDEICPVEKKILCDAVSAPDADIESVIERHEEIWQWNS
jgi:hypothetical protein